MFDLLQHPPHTPEPVGVGAAVSLVTHGALVLMLAYGSGQAAVQMEEIRQSVVETAIRYLLPPDKHQTHSDDAGQKWASQRAGLAPTPAAAEPILPTNTGSDASNDMAGSAPQSLEEAAKAQDAFTLLDVDTVAARDPESAAPAYPARLQEQGIEGVTLVRFVVDTTGRADPESFQIVQASHPLFGASVLDALPRMKFAPARIGALKVRQLVEQPFVFRIVRQASSAVTKKP